MNEVARPLVLVIEDPGRSPEGCLQRDFHGGNPRTSGVDGETGKAGK